MQHLTQTDRKLRGHEIRTNTNHMKKKKEKDARGYERERALLNVILS